MIIPKLHYISQGNSPKEHLENIQKACTSGVELVQLRLKNVSEKKILKIAEGASEITSHFQTRLIINGHYKIAKIIKADGVYLEKNDTCPTIVRKHLYTWQSIGSTANTLQDCEALIGKEVDYIGLGSFRNVTKENLSSILGLNGFIDITEALKTETPIIGFGGITTDDVKNILETGVSGIAVSEAITHNFNSIRTFNQLLKASSTEEQRHTFK
ncbi:thiamine phosphate synthase [Thalassobellus sediminis]|uniref:thiamine phosphate synthase n=1 Tax=Thalassobellus sediminis TaxID=3367753 RepID=UPI00379D01C9